MHLLQFIATAILVVLIQFAVLMTWFLFRSQRVEEALFNIDWNLNRGEVPDWKEFYHASFTFMTKARTECTDFSAENVDHFIVVGYSHSSEGESIKTPLCKCESLKEAFSICDKLNLAIKIKRYHWWKILLCPGAVATWPDFGDWAADK